MTGKASPPLSGPLNALRERGYNDGAVGPPFPDFASWGLTAPQREAYLVGRRARINERARLEDAGEHDRWLNDDPTRQGGGRRRG